MISLRKIIGRKTVQNAAWLICGSIIQKLLSFVVGILTARYLGPSNYGSINYAAAYTTFFYSLSTLGLQDVLVKFILDEPDREGETIGTAMVLQGMSSLLSIGMINLIVFFVDYGEIETRAVVFLCSLGLFFQTLDIINYWFQAHLLSKFASLATIVAYIITSIYKLILLALGKEVQWFAAASSIDHICVAVVLALSYSKCHGSRFSFSMIKAKRLLSSSHHYILSGLMVSIYGATDRLMLKQMIGESAVGYYSTAVNVCNIWVFVLSSIITSMVPSIIEAHKTDPLYFDKRNRQLYATVVYMSFIVSVGLCLVAEPGIRLLYGQDYMPSVPVIRIATWYIAFSYLGVARNAWVVCQGQQSLLKYIYAAAAASNVILNWILIPSHGAQGAAIASLVTQISTVLVFPTLFKGFRPNVRLMVDAIMLRGIR